MNNQFGYRNLVEIKKMLKDYRVLSILKKEYDDSLVLSRLTYGRHGVMGLDSHRDKVYFNCDENCLQLMRLQKDDFVEVNSLDFSKKDQFVVWNKRRLNLRKNGLLWERGERIYSFCDSREGELVQLVEDEYAFSADTIEKKIPGIYFYSDTLLDMYRVFEEKDNASEADFHSSLKVYSRSLVDLFPGMFSSFNWNSMVYLNDQDISSVYENVRGRDAINRIYYLYRGMISKMIYRDIYRLHIGTLKEETFGFREISGVLGKVDQVVGKKDWCFPNLYTDEASQFLYSSFGTVCSDFSDRQKLLSCIIRDDRTVLYHPYEKKKKRKITVE